MVASSVCYPGCFQLKIVENHSYFFLFQKRESRLAEIALVIHSFLCISDGLKRV